MEVRWSPEAADDLERIVIRVRKDFPEPPGELPIPFTNPAPTCGYSPIEAARAGSRHSRTRARAASLYRRLSGEGGSRRNRAHLSRRTKLALAGARIIERALA